MFQIWRIRFRIKSFNCICHYLYLPADAGRNGRYYRITPVKFKQFLSRHLYPPYLAISLCEHLLRRTVKIHLSPIHQRHAVACARNITAAFAPNRLLCVRFFYSFLPYFLLMSLSLTILPSPIVKEK